MPSTDAYKFRNSSPLSYTRAREIVPPAFESIGLDKKNFGLHRAGGVFAAANAHLLKAMLHGAIFLATCNAILRLRDVN
jgi:hypothetical protein